MGGVILVVLSLFPKIARGRLGAGLGARRRGRRDVRHGRGERRAHLARRLPEQPQQSVHRRHRYIGFGLIPTVAPDFFKIFYGPLKPVTRLRHHSDDARRRRAKRHYNGVASTDASRASVDLRRAGGGSLMKRRACSRGLET